MFLITGGAGYLGSVLCRYLLDSGFKVRVLDSLMYGEGPVAEFLEHPHYQLIRGDIRDPEAVNAAVPGADVLVHLAAIVGDPACAAMSALARAVNLDASISLIEAAASHGVKRFVFASTCSNYGKMADPETYVDEGSPLNPLSLYAATKVTVEQALLSDAPALETTVLRFSTLYGISPRMRFDLTVNEFTQTVVTGRTLTVFGEQFWRPYVHVRDAAAAITLAATARSSQVDRRVFNVGDTTENYTKRGISDLLMQRFPEAVVEFVHRTEDPRDYRVCCDRIANELGFRVTRRVPDGIDEVAEGVRSGRLAASGDVAQCNVVSA